MKMYDYLDYDDIRTYCDIYRCEDCPRCGDDCDGEFDEEEGDEDDRCTGLIPQDNGALRQVRLEQRRPNGTRYQSWARQGVDGSSAFTNGRVETLKAIIGWTVVGLGYAAFGFYFVLAIAMS